MPFYKNLHAHVRRTLFNKYGENYPLNHSKAMIPAHLLGNMWAQTWDNILDLVIPFKNVNKLNLTKNLIEKEYTPVKMFKVNIL